MEKSFFKLLFFTSALVFFGFCECGEESFYLPSHYHCWDYKTDPLQTVFHNETYFEEQCFSFRMALVRENWKSWILIEAKSHINETFAMRFAASRNPNLGVFKKPESYWKYSNELIGSFVRYRNEHADCSFSSNLASLRVRWEPSESTFEGQIFVYFELNRDHLNSIIRKGTYFQPMTIPNDEEIQKVVRFAKTTWAVMKSLDLEKKIERVGLEKLFNKNKGSRKVLKYIFGSSSVPNVMNILITIGVAIAFII